ATRIIFFAHRPFTALILRGKAQSIPQKYRRVCGPRLFYTRGMIETLGPSFPIMGLVSPFQVPITLCTKTVPKRGQQSSSPLGKRSKTPERQTTDWVLSSALVWL